MGADALTKLSPDLMEFLHRWGLVLRQVNQKPVSNLCLSRVAPLTSKHSPSALFLSKRAPLGRFCLFNANMLRLVQFIFTSFRCESNGIMAGVDVFLRGCWVMAMCHSRRCAWQGSSDDIRMQRTCAMTRHCVSKRSSPGQSNCKLVFDQGKQTAGAVCHMSSTVR